MSTHPEPSTDLERLIEAKQCLDDLLKVLRFAREKASSGQPLLANLLTDALGKERAAMLFARELAAAAP